MNSSYKKLAQVLTVATGTTVEVAQVGDTGLFECELFELSCVIDEQMLEIRNIESFENGLGRLVISALHEYSDEYGLSVYASNVKGSAVVFWSKMGYVEGQTRNEFFRA